MNQMSYYRDLLLPASPLGYNNAVIGAIVGMGTEVQVRIPPY